MSDRAKTAMTRNVKYLLVLILCLVSASAGYYQGRKRGSLMAYYIGVEHGQYDGMVMAEMSYKSGGVEAVTKLVDATEEKQKEPR